MARPKKDGLLYFSFDTDFFYADNRIKALRARYGSDGLILYIYLLTEIYRNGYYIVWNDDSEDNALSDLNLSEGLIKQVMKFLVNRSLLTRILVNSDTIITSPGIQKRYQEAVKGLKRDIYVIHDIWLLNPSETATYIKFTQNYGFSKKNESKSKKNESKSKKNPTNEIKQNEINISDDDGVNIYSRAREEAEKLIVKYWGRPPTNVDVEHVRSLIIGFANGTIIVSNDRIELLEYAFECSASANVMNWNYINGVIERLKARNITTLDEAYSFDIKRENGGNGYE